MKRSYITYLFAVVATLILLPETSIAQRRKRKNTQQIVNVSEKKERYQITILLPFDKSNPKNPSNDGIINFYKGAKLALKELDADSIALDVRSLILDVNATSNFANFAFTKDLKASDLIIAPVSGSIINEIAHFAKSNKINFISAISPSTGDISQNNYFHIIQPTLESNIESIVDYTKKTFPKNKKIILYKSDDNNDRIINYLKTELKGDRSIIHYDMSVAPYDVKTITKQLSENEANIIFISEIDPKKAEETINVLRKVPTNYEIAVMGLPTLYLINNLKKPGSVNISYYYTTPYHFDPNTAFIKKVDNLSKTNYKTPAIDMTYRGYELMVWYSRILHKYGKGFQYSDNYQIESPYTPYNIESIIDDHQNIDYHENKYLYIYKYNDGILNVIEP